MNAAGIPVVNITDHSAGGDLVSYVGSDEYGLGLASGRYLLARMKGQGNVIIIEGVRGSHGSGERVRGFQKALEESPQVKLLASQPGNFQRLQALQVTENLLQAHPVIDGVMAANDAMALGAIEALDAANRKALVVGINATKEGIDAVKSGKLLATADFAGYLQGCVGTMAAIRALHNLPVPKAIDFPSAVIDSTNYKDVGHPRRAARVPEVGSGRQGMINGLFRTASPRRARPARRRRHRAGRRAARSSPPDTACRTRRGNCEYRWNRRGGDEVCPSRPRSRAAPRARLARRGNRRTGAERSSGLACRCRLADSVRRSPADSGTAEDQPPTRARHEDDRRTGVCMARMGGRPQRRHPRARRARRRGLIVNLLLFGTSFTRLPRALNDSARLGGPSRLPRLFAGGFEDMIDGISSPGSNERLLFARELAARQGIDPATASGKDRLRLYLRSIMKRGAGDVESYVRAIQSARAQADATTEFIVRSTLFRTRGLSTDTSYPAGFRYRPGLDAIASKGLFGRASVRRVAVIGPGLDFTDKAEGYDFYPQQTTQPFSVINSLLRLRLARAGALR